jgi:hypothetical protein
VGSEDNKKVFTVKNRRFGLNLHLPIPSCAYMKLHAAQPIDIWKPIRHLKAHFHSLEEMNVLEEMNAFNMSVVLHSERTQGFAADPVYGRAKCLPMLGEIKT